MKLLRELQAHKVELEIQNEELKASRHREHARRTELESLMEAVPAMVLIAHDAAGKNVTGNRTAYELTHLPVGANISKLAPSAELSQDYEIFKGGELVPPGELPIHKAAGTNQPVRDQELELRFADGTSRWVFGSAVPLRSENGEACGAIGAFVDVTDRKQTEKELRRTHDELERRIEERTAELARTIATLQEEHAGRIKVVQELREKDWLFLQQSRLAAMGEMINSIAHQWRQPLNLLGMNIQCLSLYFNTDSFGKESLDASINDAMKLIQHMSKTIEDFMNFFRPDKEKTTFSVNRAIQQTITLIEGSFKSHKIEVLIGSESGEVWVDGYVNEFSQAILNILQNAFDAIRERNVAAGLVTIAIAVESGRTVIRIADNAGGIADSIIDRVFEPYFSTKGINGTGIGLFMSKTIIETNMNGSLTVRNTDAGAEFRIEL